MPTATILRASCKPESNRGSRRRRYAVILSAGLLALLASVCAADHGVGIPDPGLRYIVEEALDKAPGETITRDEMETITVLPTGVRTQASTSRHPPPIADLAGLEAAVNLEELDIGHNDVADLAPLADLAKLERLVLGGGRVSDLSPLAGLRRLERLSLRNNRIEDLWPLRNLRNLETLILDGNRVKDLSALARLHALEFLRLDDNLIEDTLPLAGLRSLAGLSLQRNRIAAPMLGDAPLVGLYMRESHVVDLSGLRELRALSSLDLGGNPLSDLSPLAGLRNLQYLDLDQCGLHDLETLPGLSSVTDLDLRHNSITDLSPLSAFSSVSSLDLRHNSITDLSPLSALGKLSYLFASSNDIEHLGRLAGMASLKWLGVRRNRIADLSPLAEIPSLLFVVLDENRIEDLSPLSGLAQLNSLSVDHNYVEDLSPLAGLTALRSLYASHNGIVDITPLAELSNLDQLFLDGNRVADLTPLADLSLWRLHVAHNELTDLSGLGSQPELGDLSIASNRVASLAPLAGLDSLAALNAADNAIHDLSPLADLDRLRFLTLDDNRITDLSPLRTASRLERISVRRNRITDISPLAGVETLSYLAVDDNEISDLGPLPDAPWFRSLTADGNNITDLAPLLNIPTSTLGKGDEVSIARNPLDAPALHVQIPALVERGVQVTRRLGHVPMLVPRSPSGRQGFVRVVNDAGRDSRIAIRGYDDDGAIIRAELTLAAGNSVQFTTEDLHGNQAKRITGWHLGFGDANWFLQFRSPSRSVKVLSYVRGTDGHLAATGDLVPPEPGDEHEFRLRAFVPAGSDWGGGLLRLTNTKNLPADVSVRGVDDTGATPGTAVGFRLLGLETRTLSVADLEAGTGVEGSLGDGEGMWRLRLMSNRMLSVTNLLENHDRGRLTNLYSGPVRSVPTDDGTRHLVPMFATDGAMLRIVNLSDKDGAAEIAALDDAGNRHGPARVSIRRGTAVNLDRRDLRTGASGLSGAVDAGDGHWRLMVDSEMYLDVLAFAAGDSFLENTSRATSGRTHELGYFNPASNLTRRSILRLVNWGEHDAAASIVGVDDAGSRRRTWLTVSAGAVRNLTAADLESGNGLARALGDGEGKWRLKIESDGPLDAMSLVATPAGLGNLTDDPDAWEAPSGDI